MPEIFVRNGTDQFGSVLLEYLGTPLKVVHFDRSGHFGRSDRIVSFHFDKIGFPSTAILYPPYKDNNQTRAVAWVGSVQTECTVPLSTSALVEWKAPEMSNFDSPLTYQVRLGNGPSLDPSKSSFLWLQRLLKRQVLRQGQDQTSHITLDLA